jgi:uncharacterized protein YegP (UPF0339 family)
MECVEFPVSRGKFMCKIDAADSEIVLQSKWCCNNITNGKMYVHRKQGGKIIKLHRMLMGVIDDRSVCVDHINGDPLDNRRANLRVCKHGENMRNYRNAWGKEGIRGVMKTPAGKYRARIRYQNKLFHIGTFDTQHDASIAYAFASSLLHGEFGSLPGHEKFIQSGVDE